MSCRSLRSRSDVRARRSGAHTIDAHSRLLAIVSVIKRTPIVSHLQRAPRLYTVPACGAQTRRALHALRRMTSCASTANRSGGARGRRLRTYYYVRQHVLLFPRAMGAPRSHLRAATSSTGGASVRSERRSVARGACREQTACKGAIWIRGLHWITHLSSAGCD